MLWKPLRPPLHVIGGEVIGSRRSPEHLEHPSKATFGELTPALAAGEGTMVPNSLRFGCQITYGPSTEYGRLSPIGVYLVKFSDLIF